MGIKHKINEIYLRTFRRILLLLTRSTFWGKEEMSSSNDAPFSVKVIPFLGMPSFIYVEENGFYVYGFEGEKKALAIRVRGQAFKFRMEGYFAWLENESEEESYVIVPAQRHDSILEKYKFDAGLQYYILHFSNGDLVRLGGIRRGETESFWYSRDNFLNEEAPQKPRILQLPIIALYAPCKYVKGLRELGYHADYLIVNDGGSRWLLDGEEPDFDLEVSSRVDYHRAIEALIYGLKHYDIFHIHSNCSFFFGASPIQESNSDISYLRKMGKIVVASSWGMCDDMKIGDNLRFAWHSECKICKQLRPLRCESAFYGKLIERSEKYANLRLNAARALIVYPKCYRWIDNPIDVTVYTPELVNNVPEKYRLPETKAIRIYHSFGNAGNREDVKGSEYVKEAVERLRREGYAIEFIYFQNIPHIEIKYYQAQADIVVEQLYCGWYGSTGMECMALGKPVITYVNSDVEALVKSMGRDIPVISATPDTVYQVLKSLIDNPKLREGWGRRARKFAEDYHDYRKVAKVLAGYYEEALLQRSDFRASVAK